MPDNIHFTFGDANEMFGASVCELNRENNTVEPLFSITTEGADSIESSIFSNSENVAEIANAIWMCILRWYTEFSDYEKPIPWD